MYYDFHTHILPGIDDGCRHVSQSVRSVTAAGRQNIRTVVCTPHFYMSAMTVDRFLEKRNNARETLSAALAQQPAGHVSFPDLRMGAECLYVKGMEQHPDLEALCLEGTRTLLIELPYREWNHQLFEALYRLRLHGFTIMLAHPHRYDHLIRMHNALQVFLEIDCVLQINAGSVTRLLRRSKIWGMLDSSLPCVLGSDTHAPGDGAQVIPAALRVIENKLGNPAAERIRRTSMDILSNQFVPV